MTCLQLCVLLLSSIQGFLELRIFLLQSIHCLFCILPPLPVGLILLLPVASVFLLRVKILQPALSLCWTGFWGHLDLCQFSETLVDSGDSYVRKVKEPSCELTVSDQTISPSALLLQEEGFPPSLNFESGQPNSTGGWLHNSPKKLCARVKTHERMGNFAAFLLKNSLIVA